MAQNIASLLKVQIPFGYIILMPQSLEATMEKLERAKAPPGISTDDIVETALSGDRRRRGIYGRMSGCEDEVRHSVQFSVFSFQ